VVDTLSKWSGVKDDSENSSGTAAEAMEPLELAAASGLAVIFLRHDRKGGGELGDSGRGSSAYSGVSDIIFDLKRVGEAHPTRRTLLGVGRFDAVPQQLVVDWKGTHYENLGHAPDVERVEVLKLLLEQLPAPLPMPRWKKTLSRRWERQVPGRP
jgi:hypothetical protein